MNGGLPDKSLIEKLINEDYYKNYGTNGSEESRQQRLIGAKFIISWLVNNSVEEITPIKGEENKK